MHGDGKSVAAGAVVSTDERLSWPRTIGVGLQHIAAMFGATFLVPIITGFPPTTTLFFSGIGTLLFLALDLSPATNTREIRLSLRPSHSNKHPLHPDSPPHRSQAQDSLLLPPSS